MRVPLLLCAILLAGCAQPATAPTPSGGPVDLTEHTGLLLVDTQTGAITSYSLKQGLAWLSASGTAVSFTDDNFGIVVNRSNGGRDVGPPIVWTRIYDNGTGLQLAPGVARLRVIQTGTTLWEHPLPNAPAVNGSWTEASDDLSVLGAEYEGERPLACQNDIFVRADPPQRTLGCHLKLSRDGRSAWTEGTGVRVRGRDGNVTNLTGPGRGDVANSTFVAHENPVFTRGGLLMLRVTGGASVKLTEIVDEDGQVVAKLDGPRRIALHDASGDGRYVLLRVFQR